MDEQPVCLYCGDTEVVATIAREGESHPICMICLMYSNLHPSGGIHASQTTAVLPDSAGKA